MKYITGKRQDPASLRGLSVYQKTEYNDKKLCNLQMTLHWNFLHCFHTQQLSAKPELLSVNNRGMEQTKFEEKIAKKV